jgi:hypothetical protein
LSNELKNLIENELACAVLRLVYGRARTFTKTKVSDVVQNSQHREKSPAFQLAIHRARGSGERAETRGAE